MPESTTKGSTTNSPDSGVSRVGGEIEAGYDSSFEDKWWSFERAAWVFLIIMLGAAVAGLLGRGPWSRVVAASTDGSVVVHYDRVVRFRTPAQVRVELGSGAMQSGVAQLWVNNPFFKQLQLRGTLPSPEQQFIGPRETLLTFPAQGAQKLIVYLEIEPSSVGISQLQLGVPGGQSVQFSTVSLP